MRNLINLLPPDSKSQVERMYATRLFTTALFFASLLVVSAILLRTPVFLYERERLDALEQEKARLSSQAGVVAAGEVGARLTRSSEDLAYLSRLATTTDVTNTTSQLTELPHAGMSITKLSYTAGTKPGEGRVTIAGTARTREALQQYVAALQRVPFVKSADLPISAYAKERDISFTITVTGTF